MRLIEKYVNLLISSYFSSHFFKTAQQTFHGRFYAKKQIISTFYNLKLFEKEIYDN